MKRFLVISSILAGTAFLFPNLVYAQFELGSVSGTSRQFIKGISPQKMRSLSFEQGLRISGQRFIVPSVSVGKETLRPLENSAIGGKMQQRYFRVKQNTQWLGENISGKIARRLSGLSDQEIVTSFPSFIINFSKEWRAFSQNNRNPYERIAVVLEAAYPQGTKAEGHYVSSFNEVHQLSLTKVEHPVELKQAVVAAVDEGLKKQNGFLILRIEGNERRPKDTLLLDLTEQKLGLSFRWISLNRSKALAWNQRLKLLQKSELDPVDSKLVDNRVSTQGIILLPHVEENEVLVSADGKDWQFYAVGTGDDKDSSTRVGAEIWKAWNKGYYIILPEKQGGVVSFAQSLGKPAFTSVEALESYIAQQAQTPVSSGTQPGKTVPYFNSLADLSVWKYAEFVGIETEIKNGHVFLRFPEEGIDNLYMSIHEGSAYRPAAGRLLTPKHHNTIQGVDWMVNLVNKAQRSPGRGIIYNLERDIKYTPENFEQEVEYLSHDYLFHSSSLQEVLEYEKAHR